MRKKAPGLNKKSMKVSPRDAHNSQKGIVYRDTKNQGGKELIPEIIGENMHTMMNIWEGKTRKALVGVVPQDGLLPDDQNTITDGGTYLSDELLMTPPPGLPGILVYASRYGLFDRLVGENLFNQQFEEIDFEDDAKQMVPPTIDDKRGQDGIEARNGKWLSKANSDIATRLGEEVMYQVEANHHLHLYVDAYNYHEEDTTGDSPQGKRNTEGIKYEWRFSSGEENYDINVIEKVVSTRALLEIENAQRANIGRYTCHVSNAYGKVRTWTVYVDVNRPGEVKEQELTLSNGEKILTGQYTWIANDNSSRHDELFSMYDDKWLFSQNLSDKSLWIRCYWEPAVNWWKQETTNESFIFDDEFYKPAPDGLWEDE